VWSLFQIGVSVVACWIQVALLKRYFSAKKDM